jgi:hypothetical protein
MAYYFLSSSNLFSLIRFLISVLNRLPPLQYVHKLIQMFMLFHDGLQDTSGNVFIRVTHPLTLLPELLICYHELEFMIRKQLLLDFGLTRTFPWIQPGSATEVVTTWIAASDIQPEKYRYVGSFKGI